MRYIITKQLIEVLGTMWMGGTAAMVYTLTAHDMANLGDPHNLEDVTRWLDSHSGDFQSVTDFRADFTVGDESIVHDWKSEDNEMLFLACMYPD